MDWVDFLRECGVIQTSGDVCVFWFRPVCFWDHLTFIRLSSVHNLLANWNPRNSERYNRESVFSMHTAICRSFRDGGSNHMTTHTNSVGMWVGSAGLGCAEQITAQHVWTNPCVTDGPEWALLHHSCYFLNSYMLVYFSMDCSHCSASNACLCTCLTRRAARVYPKPDVGLVLSPPTRDWSQWLTRVVQQLTRQLEVRLVHPHFSICLIFFLSILPWELHSRCGLS